MLADVVADPEAFFADRDLGLRGPLAVVGLTVAFSVGSSVVGMLPVVGQEASELDPATLAVAVVAGAVGSIVWIPLVLLFYAVSFHLLARSFDAGVRFPSILAVAGWGFVPKLFVAVVNLALVLLSTQDAGAAFGSTQVFFPLLRAVLPVPMLAVSAYIWYHGLATGEGMDARNAAITVAIPVSLASLANVLAVFAALVGLTMP